MNYSVLMTVYINDKPEYLKKSIESILNQTVRTNDFVLVKDGPITKELQEVIDNYIDVYNELFKVIDLSHNVGLGAALREGIVCCSNELVARMDNDDIAYSYRCELQLREFENDDMLDLVGAYVDEFIEEESNIIGIRKVPLTEEEILRFSKHRNPFNHPTVMFKKSKVLACGNYSTMRTNQDVELWVRMLHNGCKTKNIPQSLVLFRFDDNTFQRRKDWTNIKLMIDVWKGFLNKGYCSYYDYFKVIAMMLVMKLVPLSVLKWIYANFR